MLDVAIDYRHITITPNPTSHHKACDSCQMVVRHSHRVGSGVWHVMGSSEMHETSVAGTPTCTCTHGQHVGRGYPAKCYHVSSAQFRERDYQDGLARLQAIQQPEPELFLGDELPTPDVSASGVPYFPDTDLVVSVTKAAKPKPKVTLESLFEA